MEIRKLSSPPQAEAVRDMVRYARNVIEEFRRAKHYKYNLSMGPIWAWVPSGRIAVLSSHWQGAVGSWRKGEGEGGNKVLNKEGRRSLVGRQMPAAQGAVLTRLQWLGCHVGESCPLEEPCVLMF